MSEACFHIILFRPQIPPNTGTIARTCAATGARLHLVGPLGFSLSDKMLRRAGLDYWPHVSQRVYENWETFCNACPEEGIRRLHVYSSKASADYTHARYARGDALLFGREDGGLPTDLNFPAQLETAWWTVPISREYVRSLNLAVCSGIVLFEALRQTGSPSHEPLPLGS